MTYPHLGNATAGTVPALTQVLSNVVDAIRGYQTMLERGEDDLKPVVQRLYAVHESHASCLLESITGQRGLLFNVGFMVRGVHSAVDAARDWFGTLNENAPETIVGGEKKLVESYQQGLIRYRIQKMTVQKLLAQLQILSTKH